MHGSEGGESGSTGLPYPYPRSPTKSSRVHVAFSAISAPLREIHHGSNALNSISCLRNIALFGWSFPLGYKSTIEELKMHLPERNKR
jgi:hypothetical protein